MVQRSIKVLIIEDSEDDTFLLVHHLKKAGFNPEYHKVETADGMRESLVKDKWDIVISEHNLPAFNAIEALDILKEFSNDTPLIVLSGGIDQNIAVEAMRQGARDYIMKDDTARLIPAIDRELREAAIRKEMRLSHKKSKRDMQAIMDNTPAVIYVKDRFGRYSYINQQFEQLFHVKREEVVGKTDFDLFPEEHARQFRRNDNAVFEKGHAIKSEETVPQDDGEHTYISVIFPLFDEGNTNYAVCGISTDITDNKIKEEQLRRSQKMEAIGQLSGGIAHDFNNQLNIIIGYLDFLEMKFNQAEDEYKWIKAATGATLRCMDLTRQLLSFSRRQTTDKYIVDLNNSFSDLQEIISRSVTPEIEVRYFLTEDLWLTETNPGEFQDVVLNLVINARDAMPGGGRIIVETLNTFIDKVYSNKGSEILPGEYVEVVVSDSGKGMEKNSLEHVFEPFYTTKPDGKGTGLGMAMVYGFVQRYKGYIKISSEVGIGTTIRLYLPRSMTPGVKDDEKEVNIVMPRGTEYVLLVDDEIELLELAEKFFIELGYKTLKAENAVKALDILKEHDEIELLFSDVVMPGGMNGYQLADQAMELCPGLKVLLTSGFTSRTIVEKNLEKYQENLLSKPYRKADLAQRVRFVLDET